MRVVHGYIVTCLFIVHILLLTLRVIECSFINIDWASHNPRGSSAIFLVSRVLRIFTLARKRRTFVQNTIAFVLSNHES